MRSHVRSIMRLRHLNEMTRTIIVHYDAEAIIKVYTKNSSVGQCDTRTQRHTVWHSLGTVTKQSIPHSL